MVISFSALINIIFFSSIAIIILKIVFRNDDVVICLDVRFLMLCLLLIMLRMFIPVEFPIVNRIPVYKIYPDIYRFLRKPLFQLGNRQINFLLLLAIIWFAGMVIFLLYCSYLYYVTARRVRQYSELVSEQFNDTLEKINLEFGKHTKFRIVKSMEANTAYIFGLVNPYIIVPDEREWTSQEIYFILKHEMLHFYHGDMLVRVLCEILKAIYWWNPFIYILVRLVVNMQEINVDFKVIKKMPDIEQLDYSKCLIKVARGRGGKKKRWEIGFRKESPSAIYKRINLMLKSLKANGKKTVLSVLLSVLILCFINICPNILIFEPYSKVETDTEGTIGVREGNIFYLKNENGTYDVYIDSQYYATILEVFDKSVPIYCETDTIIRTDE